MELPLSMKGSRAVATVQINGAPAPLIVDSGAGDSWLTPAAAEQLRLPLRPLQNHSPIYGATGAVVAKATTVKTLQLAGSAIPNVEFTAGMNDMGQGSMGLLGLDLLTFADTVYDLGHGVLRFAFPEGDCRRVSLAYWARAGLVVSEVDRVGDPRNTLAHLAFNVEVNGQPMQAILDSGAPFSTLVLGSAQRIGMREADMKPQGFAAGAGRGTARSWLADVDKVKIGGEVISNSQIYVTDFDLRRTDMLLGMDFFLSHRIYVSKNRHRIYFTYNGGPVFAHNVVGDGVLATAVDADDLPATAADFARRGAARESRKDSPGALADWNRAIELAPSVADYLERRGRVHDALKDPQLAKADFSLAVQLDPSNTDARWALAAAKRRSGDREGALEDLSSLNERLPPQSPRRLDMGRAYMELGLLSLALPQLDHWIAPRRNDESVHRALNLRCWARTQLNMDLDLALADCNLAIELQPRVAAYRDSRGWLMLRRGDLPASLKDFDEALDLKPSVALTLYGRGTARIRSGDVERGRADIRAARALQPRVDAELARIGLAIDPAMVPVTP